MRKFVVSLLLASAAVTPAVAYAGPREDRAAARQERQAEREAEREERSERRSSSESRSSAPAAARQSAPQPDVRVERTDRQERRIERQDQRQAGVPAYQQNWRQSPARTRDRGQAFDNRQQRQNMVEQRREQRFEVRDTRRAERIERQQAMRNARPPVVSTRPAPNTQPPPPATTRPSNHNYHWSSSHWRHDKRYDWHNYRNRFWWLFQLGNYYDPFGWGYQPYQVGWRMWPSYYSSNYWLEDPWMYRLPYAPPGTQWVRYWDDAILVDTWSGQVVDVIYNFFW